MQLKTQCALFDDAQDAYENLAPNTDVPLSEIAAAFEKSVMYAFYHLEDDKDIAHYCKYFYFDCVQYYCNANSLPPAYVFARINDKLLSKGNDYANDDRLSNFKRSASLINLLPEQSCLALIATKIARAEQLLTSGKTAENESVEDTLIDLCGYAFLLYCIVTEQIK